MSAEAMSVRARSLILAVLAILAAHASTSETLESGAALPINKIREEHGLSALQWDSALQETSQTLAAVCPEIRDISPQSGVLVHYTFEDEYLHDAVRKWAQDFNGYVDRSGFAARQILWRPTTHVGCASAACKGGSRLVVCSFFPAISGINGPHPSKRLPSPQPATATAVPDWLPPSPPPIDVELWRITALSTEDTQRATSASPPPDARQLRMLLPRPSAQRAAATEGLSSPPPPDSKRAGFMLRALAVPLARSLETGAQGGQRPYAASKPADMAIERDRWGPGNEGAGASKAGDAGVRPEGNVEGRVPRDRDFPPSPPPLNIYADMRFDPYAVKRIEISSDEAPSPPPAPSFDVASGAQAGSWTGVIPSPPPPDI